MGGDGDVSGSAIDKVVAIGFDGIVGTLGEIHCSWNDAGVGGEVECVC